VRQRDLQRGGPDARHEPKLMRLSSPRPGDPPVLAWARKSIEDADAVAAARAEAREAQAGEHRRLLYVAMTRAAQRLVVAGYETAKRRPLDCWWDLVHSGLADALVEAPAPFRGGEKILRFGEGLQADDLGETAPDGAPCSLPDWLVASAVPETAAPALNPSRAGGVGGGDRERALEDGLRMRCSRCCPIHARTQDARAQRRLPRCVGGALARSSARSARPGSWRRSTRRSWAIFSAPLP
jgi:ATP-dependent helicase/nuclease subunit A